VKKSHPDLLEKAQKFAELHRQIARERATPAVIGFVYPDELRWRESGDQWLLVFISADGAGHLVRPVTLPEEARFIRQPLLAPLAHTAVAVVGLGALGSPLAAQLARAGVEQFVLIDSDEFLAGNLVRHELDLGEVGYHKVVAMEARLRRINPYLKVKAVLAHYGLGNQAADDGAYEQLANCQLIVNAAANPNGLHEYLGDVAIALGIPVVHTWIGPGGWGGRVITQRPKTSGCPECLARHQRDDPQMFQMAEGPADEVVEAGCSNPTFVAAGFDLNAVAGAAARAVVGLLLDDPQRYPAPPDLLTLTMRTAEAAVPTAEAAQLPIHPRCGVCNG